MFPMAASLSLSGRRTSARSCRAGAAPVAMAEAGAPPGAAPAHERVALHRAAGDSASHPAAHLRGADADGAELGDAANDPAGLLDPAAVAAGEVARGGGRQSGESDEREKDDPAHTSGITHPVTGCKYGQEPTRRQRPARACGVARRAARPPLPRPPRRRAPPPTRSTTPRARRPPPLRARAPATSAVSGQVNASVAVPRGATRSTSWLREAISGAIGRPMRTTRTPIVSGEVAASSPAVAIGSTSARRRWTAVSGDRGGRAPYTRPAAPLAPAQIASRTPASSVFPSWALNAGSTTSTVPNAKPTGRLARTRVRRPGRCRERRARSGASPPRAPRADRARAGRRAA